MLSQNGTNGTVNEILSEYLLDSVTSIAILVVVAVILVALIAIWVRPLCIICKRKKLSIENKDSTSPLLSKTKCPMCVEPINNQVETNCGHAFCAKCMSEYLRSRPGSITHCPECNKETDCIYKFYRDDREKPTNDIIESIDEYNKEYCKVHCCSFWSEIRDFSILLRYYLKYCANSGLLIFIAVLLVGGVMGYILYEYSMSGYGAIICCCDLLVLIASVIIMSKFMKYQIINELRSN